MKRLGSLLLIMTFVGVVPALVAAELSTADSCCAPANGASMMAMSCCAMPSCSMSSTPDPVRTPLHRATSSDSGQNVPAPKPVMSSVPGMTIPASHSFDRVAELLDPSPPPETRERLATLSCYLI